MSLAAKTDVTGVSARETKKECHKRNMSTSVQTFKTAVLRIRDMLRSPGVSITGMDSMRHICLYLMSRHMTRAKAASLGVPDAFAWEALLEAARTKNGGVQEAFDCFYHAQEDCLVRHFDRLFGTDKFSFDIKSPQKHKEILEILDAVNMTEVDDEMDILGWVYEQHLRTGASSASRDLGQFFTDRTLCQYMTDLCKPGFKSDGVPESMCDPTMGTGGFLTTYIKYLKKHHADKPIDWSVQQKEIHGCDTDPKVAGVARLNLFMEAGGNRATHLLTHDSLYGDLPRQGYDVILANMPFGLKGIKHANCCERVKALKMKGTKSEPLFLQLMMASLNVGGRCAVVVPDGMLVNVSSCHNGTRKYLLDHFELRRVIKMKGKFFMNTGIRPSILLFEKTGKRTEATEYWEVVKDENGRITETMILSVPRSKIDADASFSLDIRRHLATKTSVPSMDTYPTVRLGDLYEAPKLLKKFNSKDVDNKGDTPFFNGKWNCPVGTHSDHSFELDQDYFVMIKDGGGDHTSDSVGMGKFFVVRGKCAVTSHNMVLVPKAGSIAEHKYIYYAMSHNVKALRDKAKYSMSLGHISLPDVLDFPVPLPPLAIQREIVESLDRIYSPTELARMVTFTDKAMNLMLADPTGATLEPIVHAQRLLRKAAQMMTDVKTQMMDVVKASCAGSECTRHALSDLAHANPENLTQSDKLETIQYVDLGSVKEGKISLTQTIAFQEKPTAAQRKLRKGDIIWGSVRPLSKSHALIVDAVENMIGSCAFVVIRNRDTKRVLSEYLYHLLTTDECVDYLHHHSTGTCYPKFNASTMMAYEVRIPSIDVQRKTLERLTALRAQWTALETLQSQSRENARFILESHLGSTSPPPPEQTPDRKDTEDARAATS